MRNLCKIVSLSCIAEDTWVFQKGEPGEMFYVILEGSVSVIINKEWTEMEKEEYAKTIQDAHDKAVSEAKHAGQTPPSRPTNYSPPDNVIAVLNEGKGMHMKCVFYYSLQQVQSIFPIVHASFCFYS